MGPGCKAWAGRDWRAFEVEESVGKLLEWVRTVVLAWAQMS